MTGKEGSESMDLRRTAEERLKTSPTFGSNLPRSEMERVIHDLQVHQVELQIQNEELIRISQELEEARRQWYNLFNLAPIGYLVVDSAGIIIRSNATFCRMVGFELGKVELHPFVSFIHPSGQAEFLGRFRAFFRNPERKIIETTLIHSQKKSITVQMEGALLQETIIAGHSQEVPQLLITIRDITEKKIAEEEVRHNQAWLTSQLEIYNLQPQHGSDLLKYALQKALFLTESKYGFIYQYNENTRLFTSIICMSEADGQLGVNEQKKSFRIDESGVLGETVYRREALFANYFPAEDDERRYPCDAITITRLLTVPIIVDKKIAAVVGVANKEEEYSLSDSRQFQLFMKSAWSVYDQFVTNEALTISEARYRQLAENSQDLIYRIDLIPEPRFSYVSPSAITITGYSPEDHYNDPDLGYKLILPEDRHILDELKIAGKGFDQPIVLRWRRKDGQVVWTEQRNTAIFDAQKNLVAIEGIARDITQRKMSEEQLRQSEMRFRMLFDTMLEGFALHEIICDSAGNPIDYRFLEVNPAFEQLTGLRREQLIGRTVLEILPATEPEWIRRYGDVALNGKRLYFEDYSRELNKFYQVTAYSTEQNYFAVIFSDITQRKLIEKEKERLITELESRNAELERFTYTVSHDLKSPLITIKGFLGLLEKALYAGDINQAHADIQRIGNAADKMKYLLDDLLELSRVGRMANPPALIKTENLVKEALEMLSGMINEKGIQIYVDPDLPEVYGDKARIQEVFQNLIENAVKYMGNQPSPRIQIEGKQTEDEVIFFVRDNGIGIDPRYHSKIFGLFEKLDSHSDGSGVGLTLVKRIVEFHGGRVWVESEGKGKGSTFYFSLPALSRQALKNPEEK